MFNRGQLGNTKFMSRNSTMLIYIYIESCQENHIIWGTKDGEASGDNRHWDVPAPAQGISKRYGDRDA
jgi:hypothetical protein